MPCEQLKYTLIWPWKDITVNFEGGGINSEEPREVQPIKWYLKTKLCTTLRIGYLFVKHFDFKKNVWI